MRVINDPAADTLMDQTSGIIPYIFLYRIEIHVALTLEINKYLYSPQIRPQQTKILQPKSIWHSEGTIQLTTAW